MKKEAVKFFTVVVMFFCLVISAQGGDFKNVVVFGDSLCDSGNVFAVDGGTYPPAPYEGRFSDGPVWVEYLVKTLGIPGSFCNYAHGGAMTGETNTHGDPTGFRTQVSAYTTFLDAAAGFPTAFPQPEETLFIIWIGANDFLQMTDPAALDSTVSNAVGNIQTGMTQLASAGAVTFMVVNLPDLGTTPRMNQNATSAGQGFGVTMTFDVALGAMLTGFKADHPAIDVITLDTFTLLKDIIANPAASGFTNVTDKKFDAGTVAEGNYLFWDDIHPTTMTHKLVANQAASLLSCSCVGMPSFGTDLALTVPYAELGTVAVGFQLDYCDNPAADPEGYYWKLDASSITVE